MKTKKIQSVPGVPVPQGNAAAQRGLRSFRGNVARRFRSRLLVPDGPAAPNNVTSDEDLSIRVS